MSDPVAQIVQYPFAVRFFQKRPSEIDKTTRHPRGSSLSLVGFCKFNPGLSDISVLGPEHFGYSEINKEIGF
jgi:hypothetical protein